MNSQSLLIGGVTAVGVLHTIVPDHWVPITLMARQRGWSKSETARAALQAGGGRAVSAWRELDKPAQRGRMALLLILGSSPMVEGIPAFFAAGQYGLRQIAAMAATFAASTIATYVLLCVTSAAGLRRFNFGALERYGEVLSGLTIAVIGLCIALI